MRFLATFVRRFDSAGFTVGRPLADFFAGHVFLPAHFFTS